MCLVLFAYRSLPDIPLLVAANRDEFHQRAAASAAWWQDHEAVLAGRDLVAGGTWLGCTKSGRFAALTNMSGADDPTTPTSRGSLVQNFLIGGDTAESYAKNLDGSPFAGFNLLVFDGQALWLTSNRGPTQELQPGVYGLSNTVFGTPWPKCVQGAELLAERGSRDPQDTAALLDIMADASIPPDEALPQRGRPLEFERRVAPRFILGDEYGTRASTIVRVAADTIHFTEQSYQANGQATGQVTYDFSRE